MEVRSMDNELKKGQSLSDRKQKLLAELNKEIAAGQIDNAREILDEMENPSIKETNNGDIKTDISGILNLSATKIESYDSCPYKYRLKYIDHVPERKTRATGEFGSIIHNILEEFHKLSQEEQSKDILLELLDKYWKEESFEYRLRGEEFKKQGKEILNDYWNFITANPPSVIECEKTFSYLMNDINVNISGKIDRIDKDGERFGIVDYKTSKNKVKADQNLQMALYTEAILRNAVKGIKGKPGKASLHFLRHGDDPISSHQFNDAELSKFREKIKSVSEGIRKGSFETKKAEFTCRYCDYKDFLCPAWEE
jgi:RecB family exonuclease